MNRIILLTIFLINGILISEGLFAQRETRKMYIVSDKDGYVNVRKNPTTQSEVLYKLFEKSIVEQISDNNGDWISVKGGYIIGYDNDKSIWSEDGYIHKSRLIPLSKRLTDSVKTANQKFLSNGSLRPAYVIHKDIPHIIAFEDDCELGIWDLIKEEMLYYTCVPVCPVIHVDSDTLWLSESGWMGGSYEDGNYGITADYKLIKENDSYSMVCTRFYPSIPKMSEEEIDKAIKNVNEGVGIRAYWLFAAYCNGSHEAKEILTNSDNFYLDGSYLHEYSDVISLLEAYESNRKWREKNKK